MLGKVKKVTLVIQEENSQQRLDKALSFLPSIKTRSQATKLIQVKSVFFKGKPVKASHTTSLGEKFEILIPICEKLKPYEFPLNILFEDKDIIVVNKPSGLVVHPAHGHGEDTLVNALIGRGTPLSTGSHELRPGIVHRLDKDTSGVLVVAKNNHSHSFLGQQFKQRQVMRSYWALLFGEPKVNKGTISSYLVRHPKNRKKYASLRAEGPSDQGKLAITHYKTLKTFLSGLSLVQCQLETGRTHQIRVHMSERAHPIVGDLVYGGGKALKRVPSKRIRKVLSSMNRIGLHAFELKFQHPETHEWMHFQSDWPSQIQDILSLLS